MLTKRGEKGYNGSNFHGKGDGMKKTEALIKKLKTPAREFSPMPFWFLNDAFDDHEIVRQLTDFDAKGVHGVVLHPRIGVPESIRYLSDEFMHYIKTAVETAARLDMKIILYDEAMYPSGTAHGLVVKADPRFASQGLILADDTSEGKLIAKTKSGRYLMQVDSHGHIRGIHFGEDDGEKNAPLAADLLNPASVAKFIELTHERYYEVLKPYFGSTVIGFFTDEPSALGRGCRPYCFAWTWDFEDVITSSGGSLADLEGLFTGEENETTALYRTAIFDRECNVYYKALSTWCEDHGIALMGHPHRGDDIECERFFGIPGQDIVLRWIAPETTGGVTGLESVQAKCSADAARIMGRRRNLNECYGACCRDNIPWYFTLGDLKWYTDWLGVRGVNFFIPHAFYYSVVGKRKDERPPDVGPNNIWWCYFNTVSAYIARISCLMTDSVNKARVAVMCENRAMPTEEVVPFYENQIEFNYLPYRFLPDGTVKDGTITVGDNVYDYVFCDTKKKMTGVREIAGIDEVPYRDIYTDTPCKNLRVSHIEKDGVEAFFLTNEGEDAIDTFAEVEGTGALTYMDLWSGKSGALGCTAEDGRLRFHLTLRRRESILVMIDREGTPFAYPEEEKTYLTPEFSLEKTDEEDFIKDYRAKVTVDDIKGRYLTLHAEEMVECFVNGFFAGVSFWNEHEFYLSPYLKAGENDIRLRITGSAVNRYTDQRIDYGL